MLHDGGAQLESKVASSVPAVVQFHYMRTHWFLTILLGLLILCTGGLLGIAIVWWPRIHRLFRLRCLPDFATHVLITDGQTTSSVAIHTLEGVSYFEYQCLRHVYDPIHRTFLPPVPQGVGLTHAAIVQSTQGLDTNTMDTGTRVHIGPNLIVVPIHPLWWEVLVEILGPVYVYQYACTVLWILHNYIFFGVLLVVLIWLSAAYDIFQRRRTRSRIARLAAFVVPVTVRRSGVWKDLSSDELFPGDIVKLPEDGLRAPCDFVLVRGSAVVNESSLTGESVPVVKLRPEADAVRTYDAESDKRHTIYSGTTVLAAPGSVDGPVLARVVRTGFHTAKGQLIRHILHTPPVTYAFEKETRYFLLILVGVGSLFFFLALWLWGAFDTGFEAEMLIFAFELVAILVPPMLPLVFHIGILMSARNLQDYSVFTTSPARIPGAGTIRTFCFDKTGTLTKTDLEVIGVVQVRSGLGAPAMPYTAPTAVGRASSPLLLRALASCHALTERADIALSPGNSERYSGPSIDVKMFESTGWRYYDATSDSPAVVISPHDERVKLLKRFEFDHQLQRMSTFALPDQPRADPFILSKGSPEQIASVCDPSSLPSDYNIVCAQYAKDGCYVIALAGRAAPDLLGCDLSQLRRADVETKLNFLGLLLLRNELKPDTRAAIISLKQGRIRPVMVTGDNVWTAFYIAQACGMIRPGTRCIVGDVQSGRLVWSDLDVVSWTEHPISTSGALSAALGPCEVGITSSAYDHLCKTGLSKFLTRSVRIFSRMKPLQKESIVHQMIEDGQVVGMCGDGANDCAALGAAHCGLALSEAEASLVAAFTGRSLSVQSTVDLVREGRSSLANSFAAFKYTIFYGITQSMMTLLCYCYGADLSQAEYIVIDFLMYAPIMFFIVKSLPVTKLRGNPPPANVFGVTTITSLLGAVTIVLFAFFGLFYVIDSDPDYVRTSRAGTKAAFNTYEGTCIFGLGLFLYFASGLALSWGGVWRRRFYTNIGLVVSLLGAAAIACCLLFLDETWDYAGLRVLLELHPLPMELRVSILALGCASALAILLFERIVVHGPVSHCLRHITGTGRPPAPEEREVEMDRDHRLLGGSESV